MIDFKIKGTISPQLIFCASVIVRETQTPSMDILKQHEERLMNPSVRRNKLTNNHRSNATASISRPRSALKPRRAGAPRPVTAAPKVMFSEMPTRRRLASGNKRNKSSNASNRQGVAPSLLTRYHEPLSGSGEFINHTISSAIKADYDQPDVKVKLDELNSSVKRTRVVKHIPRRRRKPSMTHDKPFVVRKVIIY